MNIVRRQHLRPLFFFAAVTLFCFLAGQIYEAFGFGVTSPFMHLAFLIPLLLGLLPRLIALCFAVRPYLTGMGLTIFRAGVATLTVGSFFKGALDIYGTSSPLTVIYVITGVFLLLTGLFFPLLQRSFLSRQDN